MQVRKVHFYSEGSKLEADFYLPDDMAKLGKRPGLVLCNGYTALRTIILPDYAKVFAEAGYPTLAFDYRGFGGSEGAKWRIIPQEQLQDIRNAVTWMEAQPEVDANRIGLWGTSYGGAHVVAAAGSDPRVKCIVGQTGFADGRNFMTWRYNPEERAAFLQRLKDDRSRRVLTGKGDAAPAGIILNSPESQEAQAEAIKYMPEIYCEISWESAEATLDYRPLDAVQKVSPRPMMLIGAEHDTVSPAAEYRTMFEQASEPKKWTTFPVRHYEIYMPEWVEKSGRAAVAWFDQNL